MFATSVTAGAGIPFGAARLLAGLSFLVFAAGQYQFGDAAVGENALAIAQSKSRLGFGQAVAR